MISRKTRGRKGDISQVFVYIISGIIMVAVLGFGVRALFGLWKGVDEIRCINFKEDLTERMYNNKAYGVVDTKPLAVDCKFMQVCFVDLDDYSGGINDPIIQNSVDDRAKQNVFFRNAMTEDFYYIENMKVDGGYICKDITGGRINIGFKGQGSSVLIFDPDV